MFAKLNLDAYTISKLRFILSIIAHTPQASAREMAEVLGITPRQCERILASLKQKGLIARVGAAKGGHWKIRL